MEHGQEQEGFSYYEKRLCLLLFLSALPNAFALMQTLVTQYTPQHHCALTDVMDEFKTKVWQICGVRQLRTSLLLNCLQFLLTNSWWLNIILSITWTDWLASASWVFGSTDKSIYLKFWALLSLDDFSFVVIFTFFWASKECINIYIFLSKWTY